MPSRQGRIPAPPLADDRRTTLDRLPAGTSAVVVEVVASRYELVREGIRAGCRLVVAAHAPFRGPTIVEVDGARVALSHDIAGAITVRPEPSGARDPVGADRKQVPSAPSPAPATGPATS